MSEWYSIENLEKAWGYVKQDIRDDFIFDIIEHWDVVHTKDQVLKTLATQLSNKQYYPAPILEVAVPKNKYSVRPGTTIPVIDLIVLYAIMQQLSSQLDAVLSDCAYAYRLNPKRDKSKQPLYKGKENPREAVEPQAEAIEATEDDEVLDEDKNAEFPSNWFVNWKAFHEATLSASEDHEYAAITDITAFFENISQRNLFESIRELLGPDYRELVDQLVLLMQYWDWASSASKVTNKGLLQGNDVSSFLANVYLKPLDEVMLEIVKNDTTKYSRYVDDVQLYTDDYDEARKALLELERILRSLGLNVQSAKTKIVPANEIFDADVTEWESRLSDQSENKVEDAQVFMQDIYEPDNEESVSKWDRIYRRSLTILSQAHDDRAVNIACSMFLDKPSSKVLWKNFTYLKSFVTDYFYEEAIFERLQSAEFLFDYHRAYLYRLVAYSRGEHEELKDLAINEACDNDKHWLCRVAALQFLSTYQLTGHDLTQIGQIISREGNPQVVRAAYIVQLQHNPEQVRYVLNKLSYFNAPHQDYFRLYFSELATRHDIGHSILAKVDGASLESANFTHNLHRLDLLKMNGECRQSFDNVINTKLANCRDEWVRLKNRLQGIRDAFTHHT